MKKKSPEERLGGILSFRVPLETRAKLVREASAMGKKLSDHLFDMLALGIETNQARLKAEKAAAGGKTVEQGTLAKEEPKGSKSSWSNEAGPVDEVYLSGVKARYPGLDHERLMLRLGKVLRETGKPMTKKTVERLFAIAAGKVVNK